MPAEFNGSMLRIARQWRGFLQKDLALKIGVDPAVLSRAENNALVPSDNVLESCASALRVKPLFFSTAFHPSGMPLSFHSFWRKKQSVIQRETDRILAEVNIRCFHARQLLNGVSFEPELPLPRYEPGEFADVREISKLVRRAWALPAGPLQNLTSYVERAGVFVFHLDLEGIAADGLTVRLPGIPPCIFLNKHLPADRMRFTLAHELGHLIMHTFPTVEMEGEANKFASGLLLPAEDLRPYVQGKRIDLRLLAQLKPQWRVSMASILYAAHELGWMGPGQFQSMQKAFSMNRFRLREPPELDFAPETTTLDKRLIDAHMNELGYSLEELSQLLICDIEDLCTMYGLLKPRTGLRIVT